MLSRIQHALRGLGSALQRPEILLHGFIGAAVVVLGGISCLDQTSWGLVVLAIALVLSAEMLNSALEELSDAHIPVPHAHIRRAKDLSASAVLVAALGSFVIGAIVFLPPWLAGELGSCLLF